MEKIDIGTFSLEVYDNNNPEHKEKAKLFESDNDYSKCLDEFWVLSQCVISNKDIGRFSEIYFAYIDDTLIGMIALVWNIDDEPEIVISILPEKRGNHYSSILCREYTNYVFTSYQEFQEIYAYISSEENHFSENALMAGFKRINETMYIKKRN